MKFAIYSFSANPLITERLIDKRKARTWRSWRTRKRPTSQFKTMTTAKPKRKTVSRVPQSSTASQLAPKKYPKPTKRNDQTALALALQKINRQIPISDMPATNGTSERRGPRKFPEKILFPP